MNSTLATAQVLGVEPDHPASIQVLQRRSDLQPYEITYDGRRVFWTSGGILQHSCALTGHVHKAIFHQFEESQSPQLCILQNRSLSIFGSGGEATHVSLEAAFTDVLACEHGLLVSGAEGCPPKLLQSPVQDLRQIPIDSRHARGLHPGEGGMQNEKILWTGDRMTPHVLTFNHRLQKLRLWQIRGLSTTSRSSMSDAAEWKTPQQSKPHRQSAPSPASTRGIRRSSIRLANGQVSPAAFSPVPQTVAKAGLPLPTLLPDPPLPFTMTLLAEEHIVPEMMPTCLELTHGVGGEPMLAMLMPELQQVTVVSLSDSAALFKAVMDKEAKAIAVVSRPPLPSQAANSGCASKPNQSLLRLDLHGRVFLHMGSSITLQLVTCPAPVLGPQTLQHSGGGNSEEMLVDKPTLGTESPSEPKYISEFAHIQNGYGGCVVLTQPAGPKLRVAVPQTPTVGLPSLVFEALCHSLSTEVLQQVVSRFWQSTGKQQGNESGQWQALVKALLSVFGIRSSPNETVTAYADPWQQLLASSSHQLLALRGQYVWSRTISPEISSSAHRRITLAEEAMEVLEALHALYEDFKLESCKWVWLPQMGSLLSKIAGHLNAWSYTDVYQRDNCFAARHQADHRKIPEKSNALPANILKALLALLEGDQPGPWLSTSHRKQLPFLQCSTDVLHFYEVIAKESYEIISRQPGKQPRKEVLTKRSQALVRAMLAKDWSRAKLEKLAFGVAAPLKHIISHSQHRPQPGWPHEAYELIQRADIVSNDSLAVQQKPKPVLKVAGKTERTFPPVVPQPPLLKPQLRTPLQGAASRSRLSLDSDPLLAAAAVTTASAPVTDATPQPVTPQTINGGCMPYDHPLPSPGIDWDISGSGLGEQQARFDGMETLVHAQKKQRFGKDLRLMEVRRLLRSSQPAVLHLKATEEVQEADIVNFQQRRLMGVGVRTMALPCGRAALTLGTLRPLPTEPLNIPELNLSGVLQEQQNALVELDLSQAAQAPGGGAAADFTAWPEFHNGVAAGLRLAPGAAQMTRTWIVYNKPKEPSYTHAGMLMGLGLTGHLNCLSATDLYKYLSQEHDATTAGVLLGMSAAKRGTCDTTISRMLFLHLPQRDPALETEIEVSNLVQTAAFLGLGLLYCGSCHRLTAEILLEEIGRSPGGLDTKAAAERQSGSLPPIVADREGFSLAAGLALGLVCLGSGRKSVGLADMQLESRLRYYIHGGRKPRALNRSGRYMEAAATADTPQDQPAVGFDPTAPHNLPWGQPGLSPRNCREAFDPAAAHNQVNLVMEGNFANLDVTAPGGIMALALMFLRTNDRSAAEALALPSTHFQLDLVRPDFVLLRMLGRCLVMWDYMDPTSNWLNSQLPDIIKGPLETLGWGAVESRQKSDVHEEDPEAVIQAHLHAMTGGLLAVGIKYAGTADTGAKQLLLDHVKAFMKAKIAAPDPHSGAMAVWGRLDKQVLENCMNVVVVALALVMAGTGDLECCAILRGLQHRLSQGPSNTSGAVFYGNHMAVGMALGFLFYGGGSASFNGSKESTAALVVSLFPRFPLSPTDNRCHLQMFRHLHVLASENRSMEAIDVETAACLQVPITILLKEPPPGQLEGQQGVTPILLPPFDQVKEVSIVAKGYHKWSMDWTNPGFVSFLKQGKIYLQQIHEESGDGTTSGAVLSMQQVVDSTMSDSLEDLGRSSVKQQAGQIALFGRGLASCKVGTGNRTDWGQLLAVHGSNLPIYTAEMKLAYTAMKLSSELEGNLVESTQMREILGIWSCIEALIAKEFGGDSDLRRVLAQYLTSNQWPKSVEATACLCSYLSWHALPSPSEYQQCVSMSQADKRQPTAVQLMDNLKRPSASTLHILGALMS